MIVFSCPDCQTSIKSPDHQIGVKGRCGRCGASVCVPAPDAGLPAASKVLRKATPENSSRAPARHSAATRAFPAWLLAVAISLAVVVLVGAGFGLVAALHGVRGAMATAAGGGGRSDGTPGSGRPAAPGEEMRFGDLGVTVVRGKVDTFLATTAGAVELDHGNGYVVTIALKNHNPNRILEVGSQADVAQLEDDVGNHYAPVRPRSSRNLPMGILGQIPPGKALSLRSDDSNESDLLVFDRPVSGASALRLTLDASRYGGSGTVLVNIPLKEVYRIQLQANQPWQDTGLEAPRGSEVAIRWRGNWSKGKASCSGAGFEPGKEPNPSVLPRLEAEFDAAGKELMACLRLLPKTRIGGVPLPRAPGKMRPETDDDPAHRPSGRGKKVEAHQKATDEKYKQFDEAERRVDHLKAQVDAERKRLAGERVIGYWKLMCVVAKFGPNGNPFLPQARSGVPNESSARLFLQANDLHLQENSGALDVEIELYR